MSSEKDKDCLIPLLTRHLERLLIGVHSSNKRTTLKQANAILDHAYFDKKDQTTGQQHGGSPWISLVGASGDELRSDLLSWIANSTMGKTITLWNTPKAVSSYTTECETMAEVQGTDRFLNIANLGRQIDSTTLSSIFNLNFKPTYELPQMSYRA